jgi:hypothetical protein
MRALVEGPPPPPIQYVRGLPFDADPGPAQPWDPTVVPWRQRVVSLDVAPWLNRDGATLCTLASGRLLLIGGWNTEEPWSDGKGGTMMVTNEIWYSDDGGMTWRLLFAHDPDPPSFGWGARLRPSAHASVDVL